MRRARLEVTAAAREDSCSLRLRLHDGEKEWVTVTRLRAGRQQRKWKRRRQWGSDEEAKEEGESSGSPTRATVAGEGGGCGISVRSAHRWLRLRAREAATLAGDRSRGERRGLCAGGAMAEEGVAALEKKRQRRQRLKAAGDRWALKWIEDSGHNRGWQVAVMLLCGSKLLPQISDGVEEEEVVAARVAGARAGSNGDTASKGGNWRGVAIMVGDGYSGGGDVWEGREMEEMSGEVGLQAADGGVSDGLD
ncbi:hypothetical protein BHM03_00006358 [Ensete ventricosum]|uniref:Uncharacterized protein n=1 Tax=Ensete ventricosum TaxID=4639 RepID=A0A445MBU4_ENSVE|nr:hypothetical protein BHM03_00006358 [Ensete ventricosum]